MAIAVLGILVTLAMPSLSKVIRDSQVTSQANDIVALVNLTRNEAIRRGIDANDDERSILRLGSASSGSGWTGNVAIEGLGGDGVCPADADAADPDCEATPEECEDITLALPDGVIRCSSNTGVSLTPTDTELSFDSRGYIADFSEATIELEHANCTGNRQKVEITILASGQVQRQTLPCSS